MMEINRRAFVRAVGAAAAWPVLARAQQQQKVWRIGFLHPGFIENSAGDSALFAAFKQELADLGYAEGTNLVIDKRQAEGHSERLPELARELVALHPDAIVAVATPAIAAAQKATSTIPIVMDPATDPIGSGFVKTFAHPGGNITGVANMFGDLTAKSLEVLHTILPDAKTIAVLLSSNPTHPGIYKMASAAGESLKVSTVPITALTPADLPRAFQDMAKLHCDALFVLADPIRPTIIPLAAEIKIPALYQYSEWAEAGGFMSYGPRVMSMVQKVAQDVARIFKGEKPADIPVEQPTRFELVLNRKAAKSLGLSIPDSLLIRFDRILE